MPKSPRRRILPVQTTALAVALVGTMLLVSPANAHLAAAQATVRNSALTSATTSSLVANGGFDEAARGWVLGRPRTSTLRVSRSGIDRSEGAVVTARHRGPASLLNAPSNSTVALSAGARIKVSAWVRSTQVHRRAVLTARASNGGHLVAASRTPVRLGNRHWHHVSTVLRTPRKATTLRVQVRVPQLKAGRSVVVDSVDAIPVATKKTTAPPASTGAGSLTTATAATKVAHTAATRTLISANFNSLPTGQLTSAEWIKSVGGTNKTVGSLEDSFVAADSRGSGKVVRIRLSKNTEHSSGGNNGVASFIPLGTAFTSGCISYQIRFSPGFDWSLGGKLPGLEGVRSGVAPGAPTGGDAAGDKGWSGRLMWVTPKSYGVATSPDTALSYMYGPKQADKYGDNFFWQRPFVAGRWHTVQQCYTMNTVGKANGLLRGWFDGSQVLNKTNYVYRTRNDVGINYVAWHVFRGGSTSAWASPKDGYVDIDNLTVTQN